MQRAFLSLLLLLLVIPIGFSAVNVSVSKDWRVAYLLGYYSSLKGDGFLAADSEATAKEVFPYLLPKNDTVYIYEDDDPFVRNYEAVLKGYGFTNVTTVRVTDPYTLNFDLIARYGPFDCYVIVSDSAGEWVYSAGPYAFARGCAVVLLSNASIDRIISEVPPTADIVVIGYEGKRLREAFPGAKFISTGSKAKDSVEIAKMFPVKFSQVYVVSGMFLYLPGNPRDKPFWTGGGGQYPILIAYPDGMPDAVKEYVMENDDIKAVVFLGPELDPVFGEFRKEVGEEKITRILINIGYQGVPTRQTGVPYPLPVLVLPSGDIRITLENVSALPEGKVFLTFRNVGDSAGYVRPTYLEIKCGDLVLTPEVPDEAYVVLGRDSTVIELNAGDVLPSAGCKLYFEGRYGPDADRLLFDFNTELGFRPEQIEDPTKITVERVVYSFRLKSFVIYVKNESSVRTYTTPSVVNVLVDGIPTDFKGRLGYIEPGSRGKLYVKAVLTEADLIDNPEVKVIIRYGKYRNLPIKVFSGTFPLEKETLTDIVLEFIEENLPLVVVAALIIFILILLILRRR